MRRDHFRAAFSNIISWANSACCPGNLPPLCKYWSYGYTHLRSCMHASQLFHPMVSVFPICNIEQASYCVFQTVCFITSQPCYPNSPSSGLERKIPKFFNSYKAFFLRCTSTHGEVLRLNDSTDKINPHLSAVALPGSTVPLGLGPDGAINAPVNSSISFFQTFLNSKVKKTKKCNFYSSKRTARFLLINSPRRPPFICTQIDSSEVLYLSTQIHAI